MAGRSFRRHASKSRKPAAPLPAGGKAGKDGSSKKAAAAAAPVVAVQKDGKADQTAVRTRVVAAGGGFPALALVGRPNVGKSSLFNALLRREIAITDSRPGTTRDCVLHPAEFNGKPCDLVDTGGIGGEALSGGGDGILPPKLVEEQITAAISTADIAVLVTDALAGLTTADREIAARLRRLNKPVVFVVNKTESERARENVGEFAALGFGDPVLTAAVHRLGLDELSAAVAAMLPEPVARDTETDWEEVPRIAVVGRRNVGKSTFVNRLAGAARTIVSDVAGTTRDAVDVLVERGEQRFCLIDTAGLRRLKQAEGPVDFFAQVRTERAVRRADIVVLMLSAPDGVGQTDLKTTDFIVSQYKPCVILVNKWDLVSGRHTAEEYGDRLFFRLPNLRGSPLCFISSTHGTRCDRALRHVMKAYNLSRARISTPKLNKALEEAEQAHEPPVHKKWKPRLLYGVQVGISPPTFVVYCRHAKSINRRYLRYLRRRLATTLELEGQPLRLIMREAEH